MSTKPIYALLSAVLQDQDLEAATSALSRAGIPVIHLASAGGFLGRRNATLLVGLAEGMEESVLEILKTSCRQRVEYLSIPLEGSPLPLSTPIPVTVGGATVFTLPVEHYEEI
jgi:uncharacterized protein YaaQ